MHFISSTIIAVATTIVVTACSSAFSRDELTGSQGRIWDATSVGNVRITPVAGSTPYLGFRGNDVWGYTGCNQLSGGTVNSNGNVDFSAMASTMMACPDDTLEAPFLAALGRARNARIVKDRLELTDEAGKIVLNFSLRKSGANALSGKWEVENIGEQSVSSWHEQQDVAVAETAEMPFLRFDVKAAQLSGFTGCNRLVGALSLKDLDKGRVDFTSVGCTRMLCDDNGLEQAMLAALREAKTFTVLDRRLLLCDDSGKVVMELSRSYSE